jgi:hypothetical protein
MLLAQVGPIRQDNLNGAGGDLPQRGTEGRHHRLPPKARGNPLGNVRVLGLKCCHHWYS